MLSSFSVEWFKAFSACKISDLAPLTAVSGKNNCGKSSLLEAIFLFFDRNNPQMLLRSLGWRDFGKLQGTPASLFRHVFHDYNLEHEIVMRATIGAQSSTMRFKYLARARIPPSIPIDTAPEYGSSSSAQSGPMPTAPTDGIQITLSETSNGAETPLETGYLYVDKGQLTLSGNLSRGDLGNARYQSLRVHNSAADDATLFGQLDIEGGKQHITDFARQYFPDIRELTSITTGEGMIYADVGLPQKIPLPALGDGATRLISYYLAAFNVKNGGVLLLDEVGSGFYHSLLPKLWEGLAQLAEHFSCQIVVTTHSYECLQAAAQLRSHMDLDRFRYFRLDQQKGSREVNVVPYSLAEFCAAIDHGWELRGK